MQKKLEEASAEYYARAILDIGKAEKAVDLLEAEFKTLKEAVISDLDLKKYLTDPSVEKTAKIDMALNIFTGFVSDFKKQVYVEVVSVIELDSGTISRIKEDVDNASGLDVRIRNTVDPDIIGGLVLKIGEKIVDLSIKNKIEDIRAKLKSIELGGEGFGAKN